MNGRARFRRVRPLAAALLLWLAPAAEAAAQISVIPVSELRFGILTAGIPTRIAPGDPGSARIDVAAKGRITIVATLPTTLLSGTGATVPVQYGANDGQYRVGNGQVRSFDPRSPLSITVPGNNNSVSIWIGGTAVPSMVQQPGSYAGTVTVQVFPGGG